MRTLRAAVLLAAAALLAAGMHAALTRGLADAHYTQARVTLAAGTPAAGTRAAGTHAKSAPRPEALAAALASLGEALALEPSNPNFVEPSARLHELRALGLPRGGREARDGLRQALAQYREAAAMRPGSPYVWASIAMLNLRLRDLDFEFYSALEHAGRLGPWEPQVQLAMIDVGLAAWKWLSGPGKESVLGALDRGLLRQGPDIGRLAAVQGNLPQVCAEAAGRLPRLAAFCARK
jgi:hypothetical protein